MEIGVSMTSENWREQNFAILAAGKTGNKKFSRNILRILKSSKNQNTINCAVTALGDLEIVDAGPILLKMLEKTETLKTKEQIIRSIGKIKYKSSLKKLTSILFSGNRSLFFVLSEAIININDRSVVALILNQSKTKKIPIIPASEIFAHFHSEEGGNLLLSLIELVDTQKKAYIYDAFGEIKMVRAVPDLLDKFSTSEKFLRKKISDALIKIDSEYVVLPLCKLIDNNPVSSLASDSAIILSRITGEKVDKEVFKLLKKNRRAGGELSYILGYRKYGKAFNYILNLVKDSALPERYKAVQALGLMHNKKAVPELISLLDDSDIKVRQQAIASLGRLQAKEAETRLINMLMDESDSALLPYILPALGKLGGTESARHLISFYYKTSMQYQLMVGSALSSIECDVVDEFMKKCFLSNIPRLENMGRYMITKYDDKRSKNILASLFLNPDYNFDLLLADIVRKKIGREFVSFEDVRKWAESYSK